MDEYVACPVVAVEADTRDILLARTLRDTICEGQTGRSILKGNDGFCHYCHWTRGLGCGDGDVERVPGGSEMVEERL